MPALTAPMAEASPGFTCQQTLSGPQGHQRSVSALKFSPTTQHLLASGSADKSIHLWDVRDGTRVTPGQGMAHQQGVNDVAWDPQGKYLATVSDDLRILIWDVETGQALRCMKGHSNYIYCCKFDPVGHLLATGSFDETVRFWDVRSGRVLREVPAHSDPVSGLDWSPDGTALASASFDGLVRLWDAGTGHCLKSLSCDRTSTALSGVLFTPNGRYLLATTLDSTARLVDYEAGAALKTYRGHTASSYCIPPAWATTLPSGRPALASGSEDGSVVVWDVDSRQVIQRLQHAPIDTTPPPPAAAAEAGAPAAATDAPAEADGQGAPGSSSSSSSNKVVLAVAAHPQLPLLASGLHGGDHSIKVWVAGTA